MTARPLVTTKIVLGAAAALAMMAPVRAAADDVQVSYLVEARVLRRSASAGTALVVTVYADRACTAPVAAQAVTAGDFEVIEKVRRLALRSAPPAPDTARLTLTLRDLAAPAPAWVTIAGLGISPVGGACQAAVTAAGPAGALGCPPDSVALGPICVDTYEASVWEVPAARADVVQRIKDGTITKDELIAAGATRPHEASTAGCAGTEYPPGFPLDGNYSAPLYAVSIPGVLPSNCITARQAVAACGLSGKRLLSLSEWYHAASGTPFPDQDDLVATCTLGSPAPVATGSRAACKSTIGAYDMLGNLYEWTDIFPIMDDVQGRAWIIGSAFGVGTGNAPYPASVQGPIAIHTDTGFRCAR